MTWRGRFLQTWLFMILTLTAAFSVLFFSASPSFATTSTIEGFSVDTKVYKGTNYRVVHMDPAKVDLRFYWKKKDGTPYSMLGDVRAQVGKEGRQFLMATNAGIYDKALAPLGLYIERGVTLRKLNPSKAPGGNFSMKPNGVFMITDHGPAVIDSTEFVDEKGKVQEATQSGPLLLRKNQIHPTFTEDSKNLKLRSGIGVDVKGQVVFAISDGITNFYDFAQLFKKVLNCPDALYLDGSISSLLVQNDEPGPQPAPFVGILAISQPAKH